MPTEQQKTLDAIRTAIKMEIDGKEYYLNSSQESSSKMGENLLRSMSKAEDAHRLRFIEIYESIRDKNAWPKKPLKPAAKSLNTIFSKATKSVAKTQTIEAELDAVKVAMKMENKTFDFYNAQAEKAEGEAEKGFYQAIAAEEREHHMVLEDYYEFLKDPAGWYTKIEHHSLDGG